ncbi:MAG: hypothetical protein ABNH00_06465 [Dokdonia sp.]|jgi:hypothetical protein
MSEVLKVSDLQTIEFSIDKVCTLFFYGDRVLRGINPAYEAQVHEMFDGGMMQALLEKELFVDTWISDLQIEGFNLVIEHQNIPYWNYPYEWSFSMLQRAANVVLETNQIAYNYGYEIFDVHAFNVVFDMARPKYVDFGSFFKRDPKNGKSWSGYMNFYNSFYMPLYLYSKGYSDLPNSIYLYNGFFSDKDLFKLRHPYANFLGSGLGNLLFKLQNNSRRLAVARHQRIIDKYGNHKHIGKILKFKSFYQNRFTTAKAQRLIKSVGKSKIDSYWKDYHNDKTPASDPRFMRITELIKTRLGDASSLIELASNQGKFANHVLANTQIEKIIATDYDKNALDHIFINNENSKDVLPLVYDFVRPNNRSNTQVLENRISANIVMALAVTHHLILTQDVSLAHIFKVLKSLTNKYIIVEFMPLGLYFGDMDNIPAIPEYYTLAWFRTAFSEEFEHILDEEVAVNRHLFIGKLK